MCIMSLPQGDGSGEPGILIGLPSLIESGLLTSVLTGDNKCQQPRDNNAQRAADSDLDADPIEQWETMVRDEIGDTVQSVNQGTAFTFTDRASEQRTLSVVALAIATCQVTGAVGPLGRKWGLVRAPAA